MSWPTEWLDPGEASCADFASQQRLQAMIVSSMLCISEEKQLCSNRSDERRLQVRFDDLNKVGIILSTLLKSEGR